MAKISDIEKGTMAAMLACNDCNGWGGGVGAAMTGNGWQWQRWLS